MINKLKFLLIKFLIKKEIDNAFKLVSYQEGSFFDADKTVELYKIAELIKKIS